MRVLSLLLTTSILLLFLPGCGEDSCVKTLTCPRPPGESGGGGTAATGGSGGTTDGGGPSTGGTGGGTTLLDNGESCSAPDACTSGFCTDGVCCASICDGGCEACNVTGLEGTCELHAVGTDPDNECDAGVGICDGNGSCASGALLWQKQIGDSGTQSVALVASDVEDNVFIAGYNSTTTLSIGSTLVGQGAYVAKLDADGSHVWAKRYGCPGFADFEDMTVLPNGNVVLSGRCDSGDYFLVSYGPSGAFLWSQTLGATSYGRVRLAAGPSNEIFVSGFLGLGTFDFGDGHLVTPNGGPGQLEDIYVVKLNTQGTYQWEAVFGASGTEYGFDVAVDGQGSSYVSGSIQSTTTIGRSSYSPTNGEGVLVKLSPSGTVVWTRQLDLAASNVYVATRDLAVSPNGNVQVAGTLGKDIDLGGGLLNHVGGMDVLLLTLDPLGNHLASSAHGGSEEETAAAPAFDSNGNLTFLSFGGSADFGGGTLLDTALVKLTTSNEFLWGRDQVPFVSSVSRLDGSVAAVGVFAGNVNVGGTSLNTLGGTDIVVAVYEP